MKTSDSGLGGRDITFIEDNVKIHVSKFKCQATVLDLHDFTKSLVE